MNNVKLSKIICMLGIVVCFICVFYTAGNFNPDRYLINYTIITASILELIALYKYGEGAHKHIQISLPLMIIFVCVVLVINVVSMR